MIYTIKKGSHRSTWLPRFTFKNEIKFEFEFIGNQEYSIDTQEDTNKIIGLSDNWHHHKDSFRLGWRWNNGVELMSDVYIGGKRVIESICFIETDTVYKGYLDMSGDNYNIIIHGNKLTINKSYSRTSTWGTIRYFLFPYFGGKNKAPKEIKIRIIK